MNQKENFDQEEGTMILNSQDFDSLYHLGTVTVTYSPRDIKTQAIQVTRENIGAISVELRSELRYEGTDDKLPYCVVAALRVTEEEPSKLPARYFLNLGDWIVVLWDEIHVFHDYEFKHTFDVVDVKPAHLLEQRSFQPTVAGDMSNMTPPAERL